MLSPPVRSHEVQLPSGSARFPEPALVALGARPQVAVYETRAIAARNRLMIRSEY